MRCDSCDWYRLDNTPEGQLQCMCRFCGLGADDSAAGLQVIFPTALVGAMFDANADMKRIGGPVRLQNVQQVQIKVYVDHSAVEVFISSGEALTTRYASQAVDGCIQERLNMGREGTLLVDGPCCSLLLSPLAVTVVVCYLASSYNFQQQVNCRDKMLSGLHCDDA